MKSGLLISLALFKRAKYEDHIRQVEGAEPEGANGLSSKRAFWPSTFRADLPDYLPLVPHHF